MADYSHVCKKYHLGCGELLAPGYLNIDEFLDLPPEKLFSRPDGAFAVHWDLRNGIPAASASLNVVYHCHMLEHLTNVEGRALLAECFRVLVPGGVLRVVVPDLELWSQKYMGGDAQFFEEYRTAFLGDDRTLYPTASAVFMGMLHNHGHKMGYDFALLRAWLSQLGFENIERTAYGQSMLPEMASLENSPQRALESVCVECLKPSAEWI